MLPQVSAQLRNPLLTINENFSALAPASLFAVKLQTTIGLTFGYHGGMRFNDATGGGYELIPDGSIVLPASETDVFIEADPTTAVVSSNTSGFTPGAVPLYRATTTASGISSLADYRVMLPQFAEGGGGGGGGGGVTALDQLTDVDINTGLTDGDVLTWDSGLGLWVNAPASGGGGGVDNPMTSDLDIGSYTVGSFDAASYSGLYAHSEEGAASFAYIDVYDDSNSAQAKLELEVDGASGTANNALQAQNSVDGSSATLTQEGGSGEANNVLEVQIGDYNSVLTQRVATLDGEAGLRVTGTDFATGSNVNLAVDVNLGGRGSLAYDMTLDDQVTSTQAFDRLSPVNASRSVDSGNLSLVMDAGSGSSWDFGVGVINPNTGGTGDFDVNLTDNGLDVGLAIQGAAAGASLYMTVDEINEAGAVEIGVFSPDPDGARLSLMVEGEEDGTPEAFIEVSHASVTGAPVARYTFGIDKMLLTNQVDATAAATGTLGNAPTAGDPGFWLTISINGAYYAIPAWAI